MLVISSFLNNVRSQLFKLAEIMYIFKIFYIYWKIVFLRHFVFPTELCDFFFPLMPLSTKGTMGFFLLPIWWVKNHTIVIYIWLLMNIVC